MKCLTEDQLFLYMENEINQDDPLAVENHIKNCDACTSVLDELMELQYAWEHPASISLSESFTDDVMAKLPAGTSKSHSIPLKKYRSMIHLAVATAATFVLFYSGFFHEYTDMIGNFTAAFNETSNHVQVASIKSFNWINTMDNNLSHFTPIKK